jgi:glycosyltransferase involved in cell wall biosynthesis
MGPGTLEAKFIPLSLMKEVDIVYILRKVKGPEIQGVNYILLPKICSFRFLEILLSPFLLAYYTRKVKADLILSYHVIPYAYYAYIASILTGKPFIVAQTGLLIQTLSRKIQYKISLNLIFKKAKYLFVPGTKSKEFWTNFGIAERKIKVLHSTIDTSHFKPNYIVKKYDFVFIGRIAIEKNLHLIINSLERLKKNGHAFKCAIVGKGKLESEIKNKVEKKQLVNEIEFTGFQKDVAKWLNISKVFIMASLSEGLPTALMQAMACELICVTSNVGNIPDLIFEETGFSFESGDEDTLLDILQTILNENSDYTTMGKNARNHIIANHSHQSAMAKWSNVFKNLNMA